MAQQRVGMSNGNSPRSMLQIVEYFPLEGEETTQVTVKLDAEFPPVLDHDGNPSQAQANKTLRILFGSTPVQTRVGPNSPKRTQDGGERYDGLYLYGTAPNPNSTGCLPVGSTFGIGEGMIERMSAPVYVQVLNPEGTVIETKQVGSFSYECGGKRQRGAAAYGGSSGDIVGWCWASRADGGIVSVAATASPRAVSLKRPGDPLMSDRVSPAPPSHQGSFYGRRDLHDQGLPGQSPQLQVPYEGHSSPAYRNSRYAPGMADGRVSPAVQVHDDRTGCECAVIQAAAPSLPPSPAQTRPTTRSQTLGRIHTAETTPQRTRFRPSRTRSSGIRGPLGRRRPRPGATSTWGANRASCGRASSLRARSRTRPTSAATPKPRWSSSRISLRWRSGGELKDEARLTAPAES